jgi:hypothetical protein
MKKIWERIVPLEKADRSFDIAFWQAQGSRKRFRAAFDMLRGVYLMQGKRVHAGTFRLRKNVEHVQRKKT